MKVMFTVLYRWKLDEQKLDQFVEGWKEITELFLEHGNSLGSRLHRVADGTWAAYAQWPDEATRDRAGQLLVNHEGAVNRMRVAIVESFAPLNMVPCEDYLRLP